MLVGSYCHHYHCLIIVNSPSKPSQNLRQISSERQPRKPVTQHFFPSALLNPAGLLLGTVEESECPDSGPRNLVPHTQVLHLRNGSQNAYFTKLLNEMGQAFICSIHKSESLISILLLVGKSRFSIILWYLRIPQPLLSFCLLNHKAHFTTGSLYGFSLPQIQAKASLTLPIIFQHIPLQTLHIYLYL